MCITTYGTISLATHASKILTTTIYKRIAQTIESSLDEDQFGFRKERGTREALLSLRLIQNDRLRVGKPTFIAFVNLEKAFDKVSKPKLFEISENKGIKYKDRKIMKAAPYYHFYLVYTQSKRLTKLKKKLRI